MPITEERRQQLRDNLAKAREARKNKVLAKSDPPVAKVFKGGTNVDAKAIVQTIKGFSWKDATYEDVCLMLTAFREGFDTAGEWRRQKAEQLQALSHKAPCKTCGRQIDISKSGSFQIRTVRDEFFQPRNDYYCSQNCLLSEGLKGKQRTQPGPQPRS